MVTKCTFSIAVFNLRVQYNTISAFLVLEN